MVLTPQPNSFVKAAALFIQPPSVGIGFDERDVHGQSTAERTEVLTGELVEHLGRIWGRINTWARCQSIVTDKSWLF